MIESTFILALAGSHVIMVLTMGVLFFCVALFVYGLFNQPVEVRYSYQREAAIMAGHADRQTPFEIEFLQPLMWVLMSIAQQLSMLRLKARMQRDLTSTGNPSYYSVNEYVALCLLSGLACGLLTVFVSIAFEGSVSVIWSIGVFIVGFLFPILRLHTQAQKRLRLISRKVPYALDLIALSMGAGATFVESVRTLVREDPEDEFNKELSMVLGEMELGKTRNESLLALSARIPLDSLRMIIGAIIQAEELGTPLADVLKSQANLLRHQRSVRAEKLAATASVRILIPSMVILLSVVVVVFAPIILRWYRGELF